MYNPDTHELPAEGVAGCLRSLDAIDNGFLGCQYARGAGGGTRNSSSSRHSNAHCLWPSAPSRRGADGGFSGPGAGPGELVNSMGGAKDYVTTEIVVHPPKDATQASLLGDDGSVRLQKPVAAIRLLDPGIRAELLRERAQARLCDGAATGSFEKDVPFVRALAYLE